MFPIPRPRVSVRFLDVAFMCAIGLYLLAGHVLWGADLLGEYRDPRRRRDGRLPIADLLRPRLWTARGNALRRKLLWYQTAGVALFVALGVLLRRYAGAE